MIQVLKGKKLSEVRPSNLFPLKPIEVPMTPCSAFGAGGIPCHTHLTSTYSRNGKRTS